MEKDLYENKKVLQFKYVQLVRSFLCTVGMWPGKFLKSLGEPEERLYLKTTRIFCPLIILVNFIGQIYFDIKYFKYLHYSVKGICFINGTLGVSMEARLFLPQFNKYGELAKDFLARIHLYHSRNKSPYNEEIFKKVDKLSYYFTFYYLCSMVFVLCLYNILPMFINYENGVFSMTRDGDIDMEFSIYYEFPGFDMHDHFFFCTVLNWYISYVCATAIIVSDAFLFLMIFNLIGHILVLKHDLEEIKGPNRNQIFKFTSERGKICEVSMTAQFDRSENNYIHEKLSECIEHHKFIVSAMDDISKLFGPLLGLIYGNALMNCCVLLLQCTQNDPKALLRFGPLTVIHFYQLILLSGTFEYVGVVSEKLNNSVYELPWECMDTRNRRVVYILLQRVQEPISITALGLTQIGVNTMAKILKATYSYYTLLRSGV